MRLKLSFQKKENFKRLSHFDFGLVLCIIYVITEDFSPLLKKKSFKVIPGVFFLRGFIARQNHFFQLHLKVVFCGGGLINLPHPDDCVDTSRAGRRGTTGG